MLACPGSPALKPLCSQIEASGVGLDRAVLANVMPNVRRNATVQCGTAAHFWKWGDPSAPFLLEDGECCPAPVRDSDGVRTSAPTWWCSL